MAMRATNAKMDFEAFGVRDIETSRLRPRGRYVKGFLRFGPAYPKRGTPLDSNRCGRQGERAMTTAQTRISALPLLRPAPACALVITIIAILPL
jgi:hypothetical protein